VRLYRGVYALGLLSPAPGGAVRGSPDSRRSGAIPPWWCPTASAAVLHNIPLWRIDPTVVHLTKDAGGGSARTPGRLVHAATVTEGEIATLNGILLTSVARTLVDLCRFSGFESAVIACDHALQQRLVGPAELALALEGARHRPGNAAARRAVGFADGRAESPGESRTRVLMHRLGLAPPELQIDVHDRFHTALGRTDLGYVEDAALIEFDGKVKYGKSLRPGGNRSEVVVREKLREDAIRAVGTSVLRIVWLELDRPQVIEQRIIETRRQGRALRSAGAMSGTLCPRPAIRAAATRGDH